MSLSVLKCSRPNLLMFRFFSVVEKKCSQETEADFRNTKQKTITSMCQQRLKKYKSTADRNTEVSRSIDFGASYSKYLNEVQVRPTWWKLSRKFLVYQETAKQSVF